MFRPLRALFASRSRRGRPVVFRPQAECLESRITPTAVPFDPFVISTDVVFPTSVTSADLDGDGDLDVLSSSYADNKIAWYDNTIGSGFFFVEKVISISAMGAFCVATGDLDGDGDLDVVSASYADNKIAWYRNDGNADGFTLQTISTNAQGARWVATGDIDGDGDIDVVSASYLDNKVAWYANNGVGSSFTESGISITAMNASCVAVGDLDRDGDADVVSASAGDNTIAWYDNTTGNGVAFTEKVISMTALSARTVALADIDGDGDLDVASASYNDNKIAWYQNNGKAVSFTSRTISTTARGAIGVNVADVDGDGDTDVLSASYRDNKVAWYENRDGAGTTFKLRTITTTARGAAIVATGDVDSDGDTDVFSTSLRNNTIARYRNLTLRRPSFAPSQALVSSPANNVRSVATGDLDGDGDLDVVAAVRDDNKIAWYQNNGTASPSFTLRTISTTANQVLSVRVADLDSDGDLDVLGASAGGGDEVAWYQNDGAGNFTLRTISTVSQSPVSVVSADLNGDGALDVASASLYDNRLDWYRNDGGPTPTFDLRTISTTAQGTARGPISVAAADIDGDGNVDILAASYLDNTIAWYKNSGGLDPTFALRTISASALGASAVAAADLDSDGDMDVLSASITDNKIAWYTNDGNGNFTLRTISTTLTGASSVSAGDVDDDGDLDILASASGSNTVRVLINDGTTVPTFTGGGLPLLGPGETITADLDGDGREDILTGGTNRIAWYPNRGGPIAATGSDTGQGVIHIYDPYTGRELFTFTAYPDKVGYNGGARVALADVNNDRNLDLIVAPGVGMPGGAEVRVFDGSALLIGIPAGALTFHPYGTGYLGEVFVAAGDFNKDSFVDIVTGDAPLAGPTVKVFNALDLPNDDPVAELASFQPFGAAYKGGARVATGDVNGDGTLDVIAGQSKNGSKMRAISGLDFVTVLLKKTVSTTVVKGGVFLSAGNTNGNTTIDVVIGLGKGGLSTVFVYEDASPLNTKATLRKSSKPIYGATFKGGVRVAAVDLDGDGRVEVVTAAAPGSATARLRDLNGQTLKVLDSFFSALGIVADGRTIAGGRLG